MLCKEEIIRKAIEIFKKEEQKTPEERIQFLVDKKIITPNGEVIFVHNSNS